MTSMDATIRELADMLDPAMNYRQIAALLVIAGIEPSGVRRTGRPGHPPDVYDADAVIAAHAEEAARTTKQFADTDWVASALIARGQIITDPANGCVWWPDLTRAEKLGTGNYGWIHIRQIACPAHRLIWIAGDGEIPPAMQVNHMNRLTWDNRRANLELVSFGNNIRHAHGTPYINYHDARRELATLPPQSETIDPYGHNFAAGRVVARNRVRHGQ